MIRVVLDTNVIVSALLQPQGAPAQVFLLTLSGVIQSCVSGAIYAEYEEVLRRPRLRLEETTIASALNEIRQRSLWVRPAQPIHACSDPDDDMFLECAQAAQADYLITGNLKHFPDSWRSTVILGPRAFLEITTARR